MPEQTTGRAAKRFVGPAGLDLDALFPGKYLSLTSFKHDGSAVATPVWFVIEHGRLLVNTDPQSFKAKRIRRNPAVTIAPCTASGRLRGDPMPARAELVPNSELERVKQLLARKYRIDRVLILPIYRAVQRLRGARAGTAEVAIAITPT
jgi:uncharacterized protein